VENSGDFRLDLNTYRVVCSTHGNGDTYLTGVTDRLEGYYYGTNYLYAYGLSIKSYVFLDSYSIGHVYINAPENGTMDIIIDKAGNVYYRGNPATINLTRNNKGDLIKQ
ncbi:MAG: DUF2807 domain-containing protein, partial [Bacteroidetes bacterium]|nr:DUF2807 domain-containing protein [Bacteroidota bacterium]